MTRLEFIIILVAIFLVLIGTLGHMMNYTHSANLTECKSMFFGDNWTGPFNNTLAKWCNSIPEWQEMISKY